MAWQTSFAVFLQDMLRLAVRSCLLIDGILVALFSVWFVANSMYELMQWFDGWLFDN